MLVAPVTHRRDFTWVAVLVLAKQGFLTGARAKVRPATDKGLQLRNKLSSGGEGTVYDGHMDGKLVAIKIYEKASDCRREFDVYSRVQGPFLRIYKIAEVLVNGHKKPCLVLELCSRGSLSGIRLTVKESLCVVRQVCLGLRALQKGGYAHLDVKAANVLRTETGYVLSDFGFAKLVGKEGVKVPHVYGTQGFMAPEIVLHGRAGPASDIFSLGVLLVELLTGSDFLRRPVFARLVDSRVDDETYYRRLYEALTDKKMERVLSGLRHEDKPLPKPVRSLLIRMLKLDPDTRITVAQILKYL